MVDLSDLIARVEAAGGGDRMLDAAIECEMRCWQAYEAGLNDKQRSQWKPIGTKGEVIDDQGFTRYHPPTYSFSIDAALTLLPENHDWSLFGDNGAAIAGCMPASEDGCDMTDTHGTTPALALLAVILKARQAKHSGATHAAYMAGARDYANPPAPAEPVAQPVHPIKMPEYRYQELDTRGGNVTYGTALQPVLVPDPNSASGERVAYHPIAPAAPVSVDEVAKAIWYAGFKRAFDRGPSDPWENQGEPVKRQHVDTARALLDTFKMGRK